MMCCMVSYNCLADLTQGVDGEKKKNHRWRVLLCPVFPQVPDDTFSWFFFFYSFFTVAPGCEKKKNEQNCFSAGTRDLTPRRAAGRTCLHKMLLKLSDGNFSSVMSECIVAQQIIIHFTAVWKIDQNVFMFWRGDRRWVLISGLIKEKTNPYQVWGTRLPLVSS